MRGEEGLFRGGCIDYTTKPRRFVSLEAAVSTWMANVDHTNAPHRAPVTAAAVQRATEAMPSLATAAARAKHYDAELKRLRLEETAGRLLPADEVERKLANVFSECKTRLLAIPTRMRQADPTLTLNQGATLEELIREALEDLVWGKR